MAQALYRKYRPTSFEDVVNQVHVKTTLQNEIASGNFAHAYLFAGPRGIGKTTIARLFAKAINAKAIEKYNLQDSMLIDIVEIDAASHTGVDNVRENVIQNAYAAPTQLAYKVFIIDEVHMLSASAFNALLKILEEPPAHVVFVLATTEVHKVPATVISRCQRFDFHAASLVDIVKRLEYICAQEQVSVELAVLQRIARRAGGALRDAESMLGQVLSLGGTAITEEQADIVLPRVNMVVVMQLIEHLFKKETKAYIETIQQAVHDGMHLSELHKSIIEVLRQCMLFSVDDALDHFAQLDVNSDVHTQLVELMKLVSTQDCVALLDLFTEAGTQLARARIPQLPLETAGVTWCVGNSMSQPIAQSGTTQPAPQPTSSSVAPSSSNTTSTITPEKPTDKKFVKKSAPMVMTAQPAAAPVTSTEVSQSIAQHWGEIQRAVRDHNHSLAMSLALANVAGMVDDHTVQLGTKFDFHRERINLEANRAAIHDVIVTVTGHDVAVECIADDKFEIDISVLNTVPSDNIASVQEVDNVWDLALNTFGGEEVKKPAST